MDKLDQLADWCWRTFWRKRDHVSISAGTADAGLPVVLASNGKLDKSIIGAILTGLGTIVTAGFNLTLGGHSTINGILSGGGTVATGGSTLTMQGTMTAIGVTQRLDQTINAGANATLSPSVPSYSGQCFALVIFAWDTTLNNPFDQSFYILNGIGGIYTCFKVGGGTTITATIVSNQIRISNTHGSTNARVTADLITIKA